MKGEHIAKYAQELASDIEAYQSKFSKYLQQNIKPETLSKQVEEVKKEMIAAFKGRGNEN